MTLDITKLTETKVPGRNTIPRTAMAFIAELSFFTSAAMRVFSLLSLWEERLTSYNVQRLC
jgi:hypothetical protein